MLWSNKKTVKVQLHVIPPIGKHYYTNSDIITGTVSVLSDSRIYLKCLRVIFYGLSDVTVPQEKMGQTYQHSEKHYCVKLEDILIKEDQTAAKSEHLLSPGNHVYRYEIKIPGDDLVLPCQITNCPTNSTVDIGYGLPPTFSFKGSSSTVDIQYGIRAFFERSGSKPNIIDSQIITFIPSSLFSSFSLSHNNTFAKPKKEHVLNYPFKVQKSLNKKGSENTSEINNIKQSLKLTKLIKPNFLKQSMSPLSAPSPISGFSSPTESYYKHGSLSRSSSSSSYSSSQSSIMLKSQLYTDSKGHSFFNSKQTNNYDVPLCISIHFLQNVYKNFDEKGILKHQGQLAQHMRIFFSSTVSPFDLFKDVINHSKASLGQNQLECLDKFLLTSLSIKLAAITKSNTAAGINEEETRKDLLNMKNIIHNIDLLAFEKISKECRTVYQYELEPSIFNCLINSDIPSFQFCNAEREYQLELSGEIRSEGCKISRKFNLNNDVVILA